MSYRYPSSYRAPFIGSDGKYRTRYREDAHVAPGHSSWKYVILGTMAGIAAAAIAYVTWSVFKHRQYFRRHALSFIDTPQALARVNNISSMMPPPTNKVDETPMRIIQTWDDLVPGDLILVGQRPLSEIWSQVLFRHPGKAIAQAAIELLSNGELGNHVAMVIDKEMPPRPSSSANDDDDDRTTTNDNSGLTKSKIRIIDYTVYHGANVLTVDKFMARYKPEFYQVRLLVLNRGLQPKDAGHLLRQEGCRKSDISQWTTGKIVLTRYDSMLLGQGWLSTSLPDTADGTKHSKWLGLYEPGHSCSSFIYACLEYAGLVHDLRLPRYGGRPPMKPASNVTTLWHPSQITPADFACDDFQWAPGVRVERFMDARLLH